MWPIRSSSRELGSEEVDANRGAVVGRTPLWDVSLVNLEREIDIVPRSGLGLVLGFVCQVDSAASPSATASWELGTSKMWLAMRVRAVAVRWAAAMRAMAS